MTLALYILEDDVVTAVWLILGISGVLFVWWGWFEDRARGRRRCPGCLYDMAGVPGLTCPECGRVVRAERRLWRTHRRRAATVLGVVLLGCAFITPRVLPWYRFGWQRSVPTWLLVQIINLKGWPAAASASGDKWASELRARHASGRLGWGHDAAMKGMARHWTFRHRPKWPAGVPIQLWTEPGRWYNTDTWMGLFVRGADSGDSGQWHGLSDDSAYQGLGMPPLPVYIDPPRPGTTGVAIDCRLDRPVPGAEAGTTTISTEWSGRVTLPIQIMESIDDVIRPHKSDALIAGVLAGMRVGFRGPERTVPPWGTLNVPPITTDTPRGLAVGVRVEVLADVQVVSEGRILYRSGSLSATYTVMKSTPDPTAVWFLDDPTVAAWSVRVRSDAETALSDLSATCYWVGDVTVPLVVVQSGSQGDTRWLTLMPALGTGP